VSTTARYALAFVAPFATTLLLTPLVARAARRLGFMAHPMEGRFHSTATPYLGGLAMAGGLVVVAQLVTGPAGQMAVVLLGGLVMVCLGFLDDWRRVGPVVKVTVEASVGVACWIAGIRAGVFGIEALDLLLTVAWFVVVTNALNLLDNMDGVAAGVVAIASIGLFAIAAGQGEFLVGSLAIALTGTSLAFLRYNFPPARIFMGDAGSLPIGFLLAALCAKLDLVGPNNVVRAVIPILILAVPLFDMTLVVISRLRERVPVYQGGIDHSAHRLTARGYSGRAVALAAYAAQAACSSLALWLARSPDRTVLIVAVLAGLASSLVMAELLRISPPVGVIAAKRQTADEHAGGRMI
jgi:UDP-GlcNAc:undecaprenyl-phosphate GlcNAc-1-phosphate transferase